MFKKKDPRGPLDPCDRGQHSFIAFGAPFQDGVIDTAVKQRVFCPKCTSAVTVTVHGAEDRIQVRK